MKVLIWLPLDERVPGGHFVQFKKTAEHLCKFGVSADFCTEMTPDFSKYDLIHGFALTPAQMRPIITAGMPIVLSTIHWSLDYEYPAALPSLTAKLAKAIGRIRTGMSFFYKIAQGQRHSKILSTVRQNYRKQIVWEMAGHLLPNSRLEAQQIERDFAITTPMSVVPNAVDPEIFYDRNLPGERSSVICCGRIEPHKNQLGLIRALKGTKLKLILVGAIHADHEAYYKRCRAEADEYVEFIDSVPHEQLPALYSAARVHILPSHFETTGLVSLEAALCGCNIVTTDRGYTREYFEDLVQYCEPTNPESIRAAVLKAYESKGKPELVDKILSNYTWEHTARATLAAYQTVLASRTTLARTSRS